MEYKVKIKKKSGILYADEDIICIKDEQRVLNIHGNLESFDLITSKQLENRTNKVGRYPDGVYYFEDKKTYFLDFNGRITSIADGEFFYRFNKNYIAKTSFTERGTITFDGSINAKVKILRNGGDKLFLDTKFIQVSDSRNTEITCNDLTKNGDILWEIDLKKISKSQKAIIHSNLIVFKDSLFLVCDGFENRGLFQFDIETAELKSNLGQFYEIFKEDNYIYTTKFPNILCRIDCRDSTITEWDVDGLIKVNNLENIHDHRCAIKNGKFFVTQSLGDNKAKFTVLDFDTRELIYKHDFQPENGAIGSILATEFRVFVHTQDGLLHIFEK